MDLNSHWPDIASETDTIRDVLREVFSDWVRSSGAPNLTQCFALIDSAIKQSGGNAQPGEIPAEASIIEVLRRIYAGEPDAKVRMRAFAYLRLMGRDGRTFQQVADELGFRARATPAKCYREMQKALGDIPGRGDKKGEARETYRRIRTGKKRERKTWAALSVWKSHPKTLN